MPRLAVSTLLATTLLGLGTHQVECAESDAPAAKPPAKAALDSTTQVGPGSVEGFLADGRWREGTLILNVPGKFSVVGERVQFASADGKLQFVAVENLLADRVGKMIAETSEPLTWIVQGTITEYKAGNYLLLKHAVVTTRQPVVSDLPSSETPEPNTAK